MFDFRVLFEDDERAVWQLLPGELLVEAAGVDQHPHLRMVQIFLASVLRGIFLSTNEGLAIAEVPLGHIHRFLSGVRDGDAADGEVKQRRIQDICAERRPGSGDVRDGDVHFPGDLSR